MSRSEATKARILQSARQLFSQHGYERTTMRNIAEMAAIDVALVARYFGSKENLFSEAVQPDLRLGTLRLDEAPNVGRALVTHFLNRWEGEGSSDELSALLRAAATNERAREKILEGTARQVVPLLAPLVDPARLDEVVAFVLIQMNGLALTRYVVKHPQVCDVPPEDIVAWVGDTLQRFLDAPPAR